MSYKKRELPIGKQFNQLTILKEINSKEKGRRYVYCLCACGSKKTIRYDSLKSGSVKSCGCLLSVKNKNHIQKMVISRRNREYVEAGEYIGRKYNKLKIISLSDTEKKGRWFNTKCDCGKEAVVSLSRLKSGHTKSCGCIRNYKGCCEFISEVDGEKILISNANYEYEKILKSDTAESKALLHVHEAKKICKKNNIDWCLKFQVHHIDNDKKNNSLDNLHIFTSNKEHKQHHCNMEKQMREFLIDKGLLESFYEDNPKLKLKGLV